MDTKWNDIYEKIREKIKENCGEKEIIMGISVIVMVCSAVLIHLLKASYTTGTVWVIGFFCEPYPDGRKYDGNAAVSGTVFSETRRRRGDRF